MPDDVWPPVSERIWYNTFMNIGWGKVLMIIGSVLFAAGALLALNLMPWLGRLPGDIVWRRGNFSFYFPLVTCLVVSILLTVILRLFKK